METAATAEGSGAGLATSESQSGPGVLDSAAWRDAAVAWAVQRVLFIVLTWLGQGLLIAQSAVGASGALVERLLPWMAWDNVFYAQIARGGYTSLQQAAFFPLFPLLERVVTPLTGGDAALAGLVVANVACLGAFALLRVLVERELGRGVARRTLVYVACFPMTLFFTVAYTESLFLLLSVGAFLALRRRKWLAAGTLCALAALTRPVGMLLLAPLAAEGARFVRARGWRGVSEREWLELSAAVALPLAALGALSAYFYSRFGVLAAAATSATQTWERHPSWPWEGIARVVWGLAQRMSHGGLHDGMGSIFLGALDLLLTLGFIAIALAMWRGLPLPYTVYGWASLVFVLVLPSYIDNDYAYALHSVPRYMMVVFPFFMVLAGWGGRRWVDRAVTVASLSLLVVLTLLFVNDVWIA